MNWLAGVTYSIGLSLRRVQTGRLRQYVMFIVVGTVALFIIDQLLPELLGGLNREQSQFEPLQSDN